MKYRPSYESKRDFQGRVGFEWLSYLLGKAESLLSTSSKALLGVFEGKVIVVPGDHKVLGWRLVLMKCMTVKRNACMSEFCEAGRLTAGCVWTAFVQNCTHRCLAAYSTAEPFCSLGKWEVAFIKPCSVHRQEELRSNQVDGTALLVAHSHQLSESLEGTVFGVFSPPLRTCIYVKGARSRLCKECLRVDMCMWSVYLIEKVHSLAIVYFGIEAYWFRCLKQWCFQDEFPLGAVVWKGKGEMIKI